MIQPTCLIGAMPGMGKTFALRLLLLGRRAGPAARAAGCYELKGTGDLDAARTRRHRLRVRRRRRRRSRTPLDSLRDALRGAASAAAKVDQARCRRTCARRTRSPADLADKRSLGLHPLVLGVDECQELFAHPEYGKEAGELRRAIIKRGRALGRDPARWPPSARTRKPARPAISANVGIRFCLRVMGQIENDMILGTSAYKNGIRATMFARVRQGHRLPRRRGRRPADRARRTTSTTPPPTPSATAPARCARPTGTLTGHAARRGRRSAPRPSYDLLADIARRRPGRRGQGVERDGRRPARRAAPGGLRRLEGRRRPAHRRAQAARRRPRGQVGHDRSTARAPTGAASTAPTSPPPSPSVTESGARS